MKRDWEIIRAVLQRLELADTPNTNLSADKFAPFDEQEVAYNIRLLYEGGYIEANILESKRGDGHIAAALARRLTNSGHELLDRIRSDTVWAKVKETFKTKGLEMSIDAVSSVAKALIDKMLLQ